MDDPTLIGDGKTVIEMISDQVPKLIGDQFDRPSNVHGKTGPKYPDTSVFVISMLSFPCSHYQMFKALFARGFFYTVF